MRSQLPSITATAIATSLLVVVVCGQAPEQGTKPVATAPKAMVSTSNPEVTKAALEVMKNGGNAVDAMITALILQPILEPQMSTLAGGMGALIYEAKTGKVYYLDAELDHTSKGAPVTWMLGAPSGIPETSGRRIGVPGTVAGLKAAADRFGTRKWAESFEPAVHLANQGFPMYSFLYSEMAEATLGRLSAYRPGGRSTCRRATPRPWAPSCAARTSPRRFAVWPSKGRTISTRANGRTTSWTRSRRLAGP